MQVSGRGVRVDQRARGTTCSTAAGTATPAVAVAPARAGASSGVGWTSAISLNSPEVSTIEPRDVAIAMRKAGVNFWAVSVSANQDASTSSQGNSAARELIMTNVTAASGGLRITGVTAISLEAQVKNVADALTSQSIVTYARPAGAPSTVTNIQAVSKKGMKALTAPWVQGQ